MISGLERANVTFVAASWSPNDGVMTDSEMMSILVEWGWEIDPALISEEEKVEEDYSWMDVDEEDL